jgi:hypothetical protein
MKAQSWHFVQKIHKNKNFKNSIRGFCLLCSPKSQKLKKNPMFYLNLTEDSNNYNMHNARIIKMHFYPHLKSIFNMHNKQIVYPYSNI